MAQDLATARAHIAASEWEEALGLLQTWSETFPENVELLEEKAFVLSELGQHEESAEIFTRLHALNPEEPEALLFAAREMEAANKLAEAANLYRQYLEEDPSNATLWRITARLDEQRGHNIAAIDAFRRSYQIDENKATALRIGQLFEGERNLAQAESWYRRAAQPGSSVRAQALSAQARLALRAEDFEKAETLMAEIQREDPAYWATSDLAESHRELLAWQEAQRLLEEQMEAQRQREIALQEVVEAEESRQAAEEAARQAAEEAARIAEEEARAEAARLAALEEEEQAREAREEEERELPEEPVEEPVSEAPEPTNEEIAAALADRANDAFAAGEFEKARDLLWEAVALVDDESSYWHLLSQVFKAEGAYGDAESTILQARNIAPDNLTYYAHYLLVGRHTRPLRLYIPELEAARERFPDNPDLMLLLAQAYSRAQLSRDDAEYLYRLFLETADPDHEMRGEVEAFLRGEGAIPDGI